jgi:hypothetical protein
MGFATGFWHDAILNIKMLSFAADENFNDEDFNNDIDRGLLRRKPDLDIARA